MHLLDWVKELYRHMEWADARVWTAVEALPAEARQDERLQYLCHHIPVVQDAFLKVWTEATLVHPELSEFEDLEAVRRWNEAYYPRLWDFLGGLEEASLEVTTDLPWAQGLTRRFGRDAEPTALVEMLTQVPLHSTHHRGQLTTRLRELAGEPPLLDFIAWVWLGRPQPEWPE